MKGTIISPESDFYIVKDIDLLVKNLAKDNVSLKDFIENQQFALDLHDTLEGMVKDGKLKITGDGTEEDKNFEELRATIKYLKKKLKASTVHKQ